MAKSKKGAIDKLTIDKIKEAANIYDVVSDFIDLKKSGKDYIGKCPFHDDRHAGSFVVSRSKNICTCFVCQRTWKPISFAMDYNKWKFTEALRYLAQKYGITIETDGKQYKPITPIKRQEEMKLPTMYFPIGYVKSKMAQYDNTLITYLYSLPWSEEDRAYLKQVLGLYGVGTLTDAKHIGWTVFWQIDEQMRVLDGKVMKYQADGHRVHDGYRINWISNLLVPFGLFDPKKNDVERCLFGLHLMRCYPNAIIYIVESEKTAIIGTVTGTPDKVLFMATASKGQLKAETLKPLMDEHRYIRLLPDHDAEAEWRDKAKQINYDRLSIVSSEEQGWLPCDGEKADYADIVIRQMLHPEIKKLTEQQQALQQMEAKNPVLTELINALDLELK